MIRLFGTPQVLLEDGPTQGFPSSALVIIGLLKLRFGGTASRAEIAALLREDGTSEGANSSLRQVISRIRKWEAENRRVVLRCNRDRVWIDDTTMTSDLAGFLRIKRIETEADLNELLGLYCGDFLAGQDPTGCDLTQWIRVERTRLFDRFVGLAAEGATKLGGSIGDDVLSRLQSMAPDDDRVAHASGIHGRAPTAPMADRGQVAIVASPLHNPARLPLNGMPVLAVFPPVAGPYSFNPTQVLLASSMIEDVTLDLCRLKAVAVLAPHTMLRLSEPERASAQIGLSFDYETHTKLLPSAGPTEVTAAISVIHRASQRLLWAGEYRFGLDEASVRQGALAANVANAILESVVQAELSTLEGTPEPAPNAYLWYLLARRSMRSLDLKSIRRARNALRRTLDIAPRFAPALALSARALSQEWLLLGRSDIELLSEAERFAKLAIECDPTEAEGYRELGKTALFLHGPERSSHYYAVAEKMAPHHADLLADFADTLVHESDIAGARRRLDLALALNPIAPDEYLWTSGAIDFFQGRYEAAIRTLEGMCEREPASRLIAASAAMAGHSDMARGYRDIELANHPDFTIEAWMKVMPQKQTVHAAAYVDALRLAGFP